MDLFAAFHLDGQDSQPFIGVASSREKAFELIRVYDFNESWCDAMAEAYIRNHKDPSDPFWRDRLNEPLPKRAYFIKECTLNKLWEYKPEPTKYYHADGTEMKSE